MCWKYENPELTSIAFKTITAGDLSVEVLLLPCTFIPVFKRKQCYHAMCLCDQKYVGWEIEEKWETIGGRKAREPSTLKMEMFDVKNVTPRPAVLAVPFIQTLFLTLLQQSLRLRGKKTQTPILYLDVLQRIMRWNKGTALPPWTGCVQ